MSQSTKLRLPPLPSEHGAWAMPAIPLVVGMAALMLVPAMVFLFLARYAALPAAVRLAQGKGAPPGFVSQRFVWTAVYLGVSLACLVAALLNTPPPAFGATLRVAVATTIFGTAQTGLVLAGRG